MTETLRSEIEIAAPQATVFAFLTDPDKICGGWVRKRKSSRIPAASIFSV